MYERYFGLTERPFEITPNPRYLVLTPSHREALSNLEYGICARKGITLLLGEAGTGKTTLLRKALSARLGAAEPPGGGLAYVNNPTLTRDELLDQLAVSFGLDGGSGRSKPRLLMELERVLRDRARAGLPSALVVDEAQSVPRGLLEELRLLGNISSDHEALLPMVLAGQPELAGRLNEPALRQFKQRIVLRCRLSPLTLNESASYIATRLRLAGGDPAAVFTRDAVIAIYDASRGIPRTISVICDNALLTGFAIDQRPVPADTIREVCADLDLPLDGDSSAEPAAFPPEPLATVRANRRR